MHTSWINLENTVWGEETKHKMSHIIRFYLYELSRIEKSKETESRLIATLEVAGNGEQLTEMEFLLEMMKMLWN